MFLQNKLKWQIWFFFFNFELDQNLTDTKINHRKKQGHCHKLLLIKPHHNIRITSRNRYPTAAFHWVTSNCQVPIVKPVIIKSDVEHFFKHFYSWKFAKYSRYFCSFSYNHIIITGWIIFWIHTFLFVLSYLLNWSENIL